VKGRKQSGTIYGYLVPCCLGALYFNGPCAHTWNLISPISPSQRRRLTSTKPHLSDDNATRSRCRYIVPRSLSMEFATNSDRDSPTSPSARSRSSRERRSRTGPSLSGFVYELATPSGTSYSHRPTESRTMSIRIEAAEGHC
jgi:hypothetical protein